MRIAKSSVNDQYRQYTLEAREIARECRDKQELIDRLMLMVGNENGSWALVYAGHIADDVWGMDN